MNIIDLILLVIFGAGTQTGRTAVAYTLAQANILYYRLIRFVFILLGLITIGWLLNLWFDFRSINVLFALGFAISAMAVAYRPINLAIVAVSGGVLGAFEKEKRDISDRMHKFLKDFNNIIFEILAWGSLVFIVLLVAPLGDRPWIAFPLTLAVVVFYKFICQAWGFPGRLAKNIIYRVTQLVILVCVLVMIPSSLYLKVLGYDLGSALILSPADEASKKASDTLRDAEEKAKAKEIDDLTKKIKNGEASDKEKNQLQTLIQDVSIFGKASAFVKNGLSELEEFQKEKEAKEARKKALEDIRKKLKTSEKHLGDTSDPTAAIPAQEKTPEKMAVAEFDSAANLNCQNCSQRIKLGGKGINLGLGKYFVSSRTEVVLHFIGKEAGFKKSGSDGSFIVPDATELIGVRSNQPGKIFPEKI